MISVTPEPGGLRVATPYHPAFVGMIKSLPKSERVYDADTKTWLVEYQHAEKIREWIRDYFREEIGMITIPTMAPTTETHVLDVWYLGRTKNVGGDYPQATGMDAAHQWRFIFPEPVLREWFEGTTDPTTSTTLYGILSISRGASLEDIRSAYRRAARQWHPDVCREANAQETFMAIQRAHDILSNPNTRTRYDAGLALEASLGRMDPGYTQGTVFGYRSPLRCGYVLADGIEKLGRFIVSKIKAWEDVRSDCGILVTSWDIQQNQVVERWV